MFAQEGGSACGAQSLYHAPAWLIAANASDLGGAQSGPLKGVGLSETGDASWRGLASLTANRLRLIQADLADESAQTRREQLAEEVRSALEQVPAAERNLFLEAVEERFPGWEGGRVVTYEGDGAAGGSTAPVDIAELNDPAFLIRQLVKKADKMSAEDRSAAGERLAAAGIAPPGVGEIPAEAVARVKAALQLATETNADPGRMLECLALMTEQVLSLDRLVWTTWQQMAPGSGHKKRTGVGGVVKSYVGGGSDVGRQQVAEELGRFRQLTAAMLASIAQAGEQAYRQMHKISPQQVEHYAKAEKKWNESVEQACWRKYCEMAGEVDQSSVENEVIKAMATFATTLMK
ncbi:MAG: hypothetical protein CMJ31_06460 [Phycisphaerae bacterium]|nr:hypothetical protein [Phycisphaerae bacterium]